MKNLGTLLTDDISECLIAIQNSIEECRPFTSADVPENIDFLDVCIKNGKEITRLAKILRDNKETL